jgi:hypothetical protein
VNFDHDGIKLSPLRAGLFSGTADGALDIDLRGKVPAIARSPFRKWHRRQQPAHRGSPPPKTRFFGFLAAGKTNLQFTVAPDGDIVEVLNGTLGFV